MSRAIDRRRVGIAVLAFGLPPAIWFATAALLIGGDGISGGNVGRITMIAAIYAAPLVGFAFIAFGLGRWRDFDRRQWLIMIAVSAFYWVVYVPVLWTAFTAIVVRRAGI